MEFTSFIKRWVKMRKMIFIGDAIFEGGNDFPATTTGAACIKVKEPEETKKVIETIIACFNMKQKTNRPL